MTKPLTADERWELCRQLAIERREAFRQSGRTPTAADFEQLLVDLRHALALARVEQQPAALP